MKMTMKSDSEIQSDVLKELKWDTRVEETEVGVQVHQGIVTLVGTVTSYAKKLAAQEAAHRVSGVLDVANDITVRVPGNLARTDTEIAQAVRRALEWDVMIPYERIRSTVENGWVILEGTVKFLHEKQDAERAIANLIGVQGVTNSIAIQATSPQPRQLRQKIEEALERHAQRQANLEARHIQVEIQDGTVTLSGEVRSWPEEKAIVGAVSHAPGVQQVKDRLRVNPYG